MYLADINVDSHGAPRRDSPAQNDALSAWLASNAHRVWISAVTVAELAFGAADLRRRRATRRAEQLEAWIDALLDRYRHHLLPIDAATARLAGMLLARAVAAGRDPGMEDAMIAATAQRSGLTLLTRNIADFTAMGIVASNPFDSLPSTPRR